VTRDNDEERHQPHGKSQQSGLSPVRRFIATAASLIHGVRFGLSSSEDSVAPYIEQYVCHSGGNLLDDMKPIGLIGLFLIGSHGNVAPSHRQRVLYGCVLQI